MTFSRRPTLATRALVVEIFLLVTINGNGDGFFINGAEGIAFIYLPSAGQNTNLSPVPSYEICVSKENDPPPSYEVVTSLTTG